MYQLKKNVQSFTLVEGPLGRKTFSPGETYDQIPPGMESKFETTDMGDTAGDTFIRKVSPREVSPMSGIQDAKPKKRQITPDPPQETTEEVK